MKKLFRNFLKGASLTTALFIFQACYGTPPGMYDGDGYIIFEVVDAADSKPLPGVMVKSRFAGSEDWYDEGTTDSFGRLVVPVQSYSGVDFNFDAGEKELYADFDTTLFDLSSRTIEIKMNKSH